MIVMGTPGWMKPAHPDDDSSSGMPAAKVVWWLIDHAFFFGADDEAESLAFELVELDHGVLRFALAGLAADSISNQPYQFRNRRLSPLRHVPSLFSSTRAGSSSSG